MGKNEADGSIGSCGGRKEAEGKPSVCLRKKHKVYLKRKNWLQEKGEKILTQTEKVNLLWFQIN